MFVPVFVFVLFSLLFTVSLCSIVDAMFLGARLLSLRSSFKRTAVWLLTDDLPTNLTLYDAR